ncbi:putative G-protein coupled receptor 139 [Tubulanus polymorphus]|uniref:putative G-protein coupled receptor 139 n=1 Tax=Tubulanus polymorphus TaxID=672921 RepID=UPI003DA68953
MLLKSNSKTSICCYFAFLAIVDTLFLCVPLLCYWINYNFNRTGKKEWLCKSINFVANFLSQLSAWIVVAITVDRLIAVRFPMKAKVLCSSARSLRVIAGLVLILFASNVHIFWSATLVNVKIMNRLQCEWKINDSPNLNETVFLVDLAAGSFLPFLLLCGLNTAIVYTLCRHSTDKSLRAGHQSRVGFSPGRLLKMQMIVAWTFLFLSAPFRLHRLIFHYILAADNLRLERMLFSITHKLFFANSAVNFYVYCLCGGSRFRKHLVDLFRCTGARD